MIKLFRHIRQNLIMENKSANYLKYVIGEIVLVVIGILIALQINNWNESRKERVVETELLRNLRNSLISDIENQIDPFLNQIQLDLKNIDDIKHFFNTSEIYNDSMNIKFNSIMYSKNFAYEVTSYKALENAGIQLIQNTELKTQILKLYNMSYPDLDFVISNFMNNLIAFFRPNIRELFWFLDNNREKGYLPIDYDILRKNRDFKNNLIVCTENCTNMYVVANDIKKEVQLLIELIDDVLKTRN